MRSLIVLMALTGSAALAQEQTDEAAPEVEQAAEVAAADSTDAENSNASSAGGARSMLGMSILGNEEAPKALVIVPWKSSQIGDGMGVTNSMDDRARPVDREVFMRELRYYELRSGASEQ